MPGLCSSSRKRLRQTDSERRLSPKRGRVVATQSERSSEVEGQRQRSPILTQPRRTKAFCGPSICATPRGTTAYLLTRRGPTAVPRHTVMERLACWPPDPIQTRSAPMAFSSRHRSPCPAGLYAATIISTSNAGRWHLRSLSMPVLDGRVVAAVRDRNEAQTDPGRYRCLGGDGGPLVALARNAPFRSTFRPRGHGD